MKDRLRKAREKAKDRSSLTDVSTYVRDLRRWRFDDV